MPPLTWFVTTITLLSTTACGDDGGTDAAVDSGTDIGADSTPGADSGRADADADVDSGVTPSVIATGQDKPTGLAFGEGRLFWSNEDAGSVVSCDPARCMESMLTVVSGLSTPRGLSVFGGDVYFVSEAGAQRCATGGCAGAPIDVVPLGAANWDVAVDSTRIIVTQFPGALFQCPPSGCADGTMPTQLASGEGMMGVAITAETIYFTRWGSRRVMQCPVDTDCAATQSTLAEGVVSPNGIAVDETHVYWSSSNFMPVGSDIEGVIVRCPVAGCPMAPVEVVSTPGAEPFGVALDRNVLFWTDPVAGTVNRHPL